MYSICSFIASQNITFERSYKKRSKKCSESLCTKQEMQLLDPHASSLINVRNLKFPKHIIASMNIISTIQQWIFCKNERNFSFYDFGHGMQK